MTGVSGRLTALDGVRGLAIALVIVGHTLPVRFGVGAPVGVATFFALSGFLITRLLLTEHDRTGDVKLGAFWLRRARRLLPALFVFIAVSLLLGYTVDPAFGNLAAAWPAVIYVANLNHAYEFGWLGGALTPSEGLEHLWSLSVEEQFYLLWPLAFVALVRRPRALLLALLMAAAISLALRGWSYAETGSSFYLYARPDTTACLLLLGCALAAWQHQGGRIPRRFATPALAALIGIGFWTMPAVYSLPIAAGLATVAIGAVADGGPGWLSHPAMTLLGRRSYALYLWHWPALTAWLMLGGGVLLWVGFMGAAWAATLASWRWVESPFTSTKASATMSYGGRRRSTSIAARTLAP